MAKKKEKKSEKKKKKRRPYVPKLPRRPAGIKTGRFKVRGKNGFSYLSG